MLKGDPAFSAPSDCCQTKHETTKHEATQLRRVLVHNTLCNPFKYKAAMRFGFLQRILIALPCLTHVRCTPLFKHLQALQSSGTFSGIDAAVASEHITQ